LIPHDEIPKLLSHLKTRSGLPKDIGKPKNWRLLKALVSILTGQARIKRETLHKILAQRDVPKDEFYKMAYLGVN
jgi:hypothetical protein